MDYSNLISKQLIKVKRSQAQYQTAAAIASHTTCDHRGFETEFLKHVRIYNYLITRAARMNNQSFRPHGPWSVTSMLRKVF